jgi:hypothetical protein
MEANPSFQHIEINDLTEDLPHDSRDCSYKLRWVRKCEGFTIDLDDAGKRKYHVEHADPRIRFILDVIRGNALVWVDTHEDLANFDKLAYEGWMTSDELLDRSVVTEIPEITKDRHEGFASEWGALNVYVLFGRRRGEDVLVLNVVGEKVNNEVEQMCHEIVMRNNV